MVNEDVYWCVCRIFIYIYRTLYRICVSEILVVCVYECFLLFLHNTILCANSTNLIDDRNVHSSCVRCECVKIWAEKKRYWFYEKKRTKSLTLSWFKFIELYDDAGDADDDDVVVDEIRRCRQECWSVTDDDVLWSSGIVCSFLDKFDVLIAPIPDTVEW